MNATKWFMNTRRWLSSNKLKVLIPDTNVQDHTPGRDNNYTCYLGNSTVEEGCGQHS